MPERTGAQNAVIASGLIVVGVGLAWLSLAVVVGVGIGRAVRLADRAACAHGTRPVDRLGPAS